MRIHTVALLLLGISIQAQDSFAPLRIKLLPMNKGDRTEFQSVPVSDRAKYTLSFRAELAGPETLEDNPRMQLTLQPKRNPHDSTYHFLPKMKLLFYGTDNKLIATKRHASLPFRKHHYKVTFYPPYGAIQMKLIIRAGNNSRRFVVKDMNFAPTPDEGAINTHPVTTLHGLYDYSAWEHFAAGASMILLPNGKVGFNSGYGSTSARFPLQPNTTYLGKSKVTSLGYATTIEIRVLDKNNKMIQQTRIWSEKGVKFRTPPNCVSAVIHARSAIVEEVHVQEAK